MHIGMNMKGIWKENEGSEYTWKEHEREWKENDRKWMQNERNMHANECKMKGTWGVAEAPETNKTTPQSISEPV